MEAGFLEKKQIIQNQAEKLKTEEQLAEPKARSHIFAALKGDNLLRGGLMSLKEDENIKHQLLMIKVIEEINMSSTHQGNTNAVIIQSR